MTAPACTYCSRPFTDLRGCDFDEDPAPVLFGSESDAFADLFGANPAELNPGPECSDCGTPRGKAHHAECLKSECPSCHHQFGLCGSVDCDEVWAWSTGRGGTHAA